MTYGIYDSEDNCWLGVNATNDGPKTFEDKMLARCAAEIASIQLGYMPNRLKERLYNTPVSLRFKDEISTKMSPLEALQRKEDGRAL